MALADAQAAFRHSPGRVTALAYMDAAIEKWTREDRVGADRPYIETMQEVRDWLMNERVP